MTVRQLTPFLVISFGLTWGLAAVIALLEPIQTRLAEFDDDTVIELLHGGADKARAIAGPVIPPSIEIWAAAMFLAPVIGLITQGCVGTEDSDIRNCIDLDGDGSLSPGEFTAHHRHHGGHHHGGSG